MLLKITSVVTSDSENWYFSLCLSTRAWFHYQSIIWAIKRHRIDCFVRKHLKPKYIQFAVTEDKEKQPFETWKEWILLGNDTWLSQLLISWLINRFSRIQHRIQGVKMHSYSSKCCSAPPHVHCSCSSLCSPEELCCSVVLESL